MSQMSPDFNYPLPSVMLNTASIGIPQVVNVGQKFITDAWVRIANESPDQLAVQIGVGTYYQVSPQTEDIFPLKGETVLTITPTLLLPTAAPSAQVKISVYPYGQPSGTYPVALARQAVPTAGASSFGWSAMDIITSASATNPCAVNIFNPLNSGVSYTFYSVRYTSNDSAGANTPLLQYTIGNDVAFPDFTLSGTNQVTSNGIGDGRATQAHITENFGTHADPVATGIYEQAQYAAGTYFEFLVNGDQKKLPPGANLTLISTVTAGKFFAFRFLWLDQQ